TIAEQDRASAVVLAGVVDEDASGDDESVLGGVVRVVDREIDSAAAKAPARSAGAGQSVLERQIRERDALACFQFVDEGGIYAVRGRVDGDRRVGPGRSGAACPGDDGQGDEHPQEKDEATVHERAGKMPCRAMMNVRPKKGGMLLCGRLPPADVVETGFICTLPAPEVVYIRVERPA